VLPLGRARISPTIVTKSICKAEVKFPGRRHWWRFIPHLALASGHRTVVPANTLGLPSNELLLAESVERLLKHWLIRAVRGLVFKHSLLPATM